MIIYDTELKRLRTSEDVSTELYAVYDFMLGKVRVADRITDELVIYDPILKRKRMSLGAKVGVVSDAAATAEGTFSGSIDPRGVMTAITLQWGASEAEVLAGTHEEGIGNFGVSGSWSNPVSAEFPELTYWRYKAVNSFGTSYTAIVGTEVNVLADGYAFNKPTVGVYECPVTATTNWTMRRTGGTPAAALSVVDITDANDIERIGSNKALRFVTGATGHTANSVRYTVQVGGPTDFTGQSILVWVKLEEGADISLWSKILGLNVILFKDLTNYITYLLGASTVEYSSHGWYAFSLTPAYGGTKTGTVELNQITAIGINVIKALATDSPVIQIGMLSVVTKPAKAQVLILADGNYGTHLTVANLLNANGMKGTFFVEPESIESLTVPQMLTMQGQGHTIGAYCRNWGANVSPIANALSILTTCQTFLTSNGLTGGKHMVHGITSTMTEEAWKALIPDYVKTVTFAGRTLTSRYHKSYNGRYHEFSAANKAALIGIVGNAVTDGAKMGILCHSLADAEYTAFEDFVVNTLKPLQDAGSIEVISSEQAYSSN